MRLASVVSWLVFPGLLPVFLASCAAGGRSGAAPQTGPEATGAGAGGTGNIVLLDPVGDGDGPGTYTYPTDAAFAPGSLDITRFEVKDQGQLVELTLGVAARVEDPWNSRASGGNGFSVQMAFVFLDTDHREGIGVEEGLPGLDIRFERDEAWDRVVILSPQAPERVEAAVARTVPWLKNRIIVPTATRAASKSIIATVPKARLGGSPSARWGYQVCMQANAGFPGDGDLFMLPVAMHEGPRQFGGGVGSASDPQVIDILVPPAKGGPAEAQKQHELLSKYHPTPTDPRPQDLAVVPMVYPGS